MAHSPTGARWIAGLAAVAALSAALAGCASTSSTSASTPLPTATATVKPSTSPAPETSSLGMTCDQLLPSSVINGLAPQFTPLPSYTPATGSYAAQIASFGGVTCSWSDAGGDTLTLAVAKPTRDQVTAAETGIGNAGTASTAFGSDVKAWTANSGGTFSGDFEVFPEAGYWISTTSSLYKGPDSAQAKTVIDYVLQALPSS